MGVLIIMSSKLKSIAERKKHWCSFLDMNSDTKHVFQVNLYKDIDSRRPLPWKSLKKERIKWILENYNARLEAIEWLNDDSIPYIDMLTGTEIFAEAFGCEVYRPSDNMPFARPLIQEAKKVSKLKIPDLWNSSLTYLFEMADELKAKAGLDAILRMVDIQSPLDIAALIWEKSEFYVAFIEEPEAVRELAAKVNVLLTQFVDEWFKRYGKEFIAHYPNYYMPHGLTLSEDEIGVVSPATFNEFFLPELTELSIRYGGLGIHCCADSMHQWSNFKKIPELKILNFGRPDDQLLLTYKKFETHTAQIPSKIFDGLNPEVWIDTLPKKAHIAIEVNAKDKKEAIMICDKLNTSRFTCL